MLYIHKRPIAINWLLIFIKLGILIEHCQLRRHLKKLDLLERDGTCRFYEEMEYTEL